GIADRAARRLSQMFPAIRIAGTHSGSPSAAEDEAIRVRIRESGARVLLVAYGMPAQERWLLRNLPRLPSVLVRIGVGGGVGPLAGWKLRTSYLQRLLIGESHRLLLPLYPNAARALRVGADADVLIVSTSAFIKGISVAERTVEVAYCHSPTRFLWDWSDRYLREEVPVPLHGVVRDLLARLRETDRASASRVDRWVANSRTVAERIHRYYERDSEVVYPPIDVEAFRCDRERGDFWMFVGGLSAYKRADVAVRAFTEL